MLYSKIIVAAFIGLAAAAPPVQSDKPKPPHHPGPIHEARELAPCKVDGDCRDGFVCLEVDGKPICKDPKDPHTPKPSNEARDAPPPKDDKPKPPKPAKPGHEAREAPRGDKPKPHHPPKPSHEARGDAPQDDKPKPPHPPKPTKEARDAPQGDKPKPHHPPKPTKEAREAPELLCKIDKDCPKGKKCIKGVGKSICA